MKKSSVKKVYIEPGCISCGSCEQIAPKIFEITDIANIKDVKDGVLIKEHEKEIYEAVNKCPVSVIKVEEE